MEETAGERERGEEAGRENDLGRRWRLTEKDGDETNRRTGIRKDWPREREKENREEDRGGKAPSSLYLASFFLPSRALLGQDNWGHRGPVGLASHGFVPSLLSHGYESKNLGLDVYTCLHVYTGCPGYLPLFLLILIERTLLELRIDDDRIFRPLVPWGSAM